MHLLKVVRISGENLIPVDADDPISIFEHRNGVSMPSRRRWTRPSSQAWGGTRLFR
jgi:hypothetical protein